MDTSPTKPTKPTKPTAANPAAKRPLDNNANHEHEGRHAAPADNSSSDSPPTITLLSRLAPALLPATTCADPSVDPATLAIPQWTGPCTLTLSPAVPHLPLTGGEVTVANTRVYYWHAETKVGFALDYRAMVMHAVASTGEDARPKKSVYCQLAVDVKREIARGVAAVVVGAEKALGVHVDGGEDEEDMDEDEAFSELTIVPMDGSQVDDLFSALSMCASMHPDPMDEDQNDNDMDVDMMMAMMSGNHGMDLELSEQGQANAARFEAMLDNAMQGQFDDADDGEEDDSPCR